MLTIHLQQLKFFAYHGLYEEEKIAGNNFEMDIAIEMPEQENISAIEQTLDYTKVYEIVRTRMSVPTPLLETLAQETAELIYLADNRIKSISLSVKKLSPPIKDFKGSVGVTVKKVF